MSLIVPVVMSMTGSIRETWRIELKSKSEDKWARVFISSIEKLVRRLSPRVEARLNKSVMERDFAKILSLMPMRIFCCEAPREKSPLVVPWRARARPRASSPVRVYSTPGSNTASV